MSEKQIVIDVEEGVDFKGQLSYRDCERIIDGCNEIIKKMLEHMQKQVGIGVIVSAEAGALAQEIYGEDGKIPAKDLEDAAQKGFEFLYPNGIQVKK